MTRRKERQKKGYLGHRSHGRGNVKNRRGSGNRGGRGMAGIDKHKWSWAMLNAPEYFGKHGFKRPHGAGGRKVPVIHLFDINQQALNNKLEKKGGKYHVEFKGKVLATGNVTVPLSVRAESWSRNVEKKITDAGGDISKSESAQARVAGPKGSAPKPQAAKAS